MHVKHLHSDSDKDDCLHHIIVWLGGVVVRASDLQVATELNRDVAGSSPGRSAPRNNSGQVVPMHVPPFTKQYNLVPAQAAS